MNPTLPPSSGTPYSPPPGPASGQTIEAVKMPAIFLAIFGGLVVLFALFSIVVNATAPDLLAKLMANNPSVTPEMKARMAESGGSVSNYVFGAIWLLTGGLMIFGGLQMMKLKNFGLSMAAAIVALIPCVGGHCCCLPFGLAVGIWSLIVLNKPEVKASFT